jgi:diaminohydroxyphosphoribosylaminopyrimidine deaminase/5-amino-6-(5-phosphoribosylamino)uracil reductase
MEKALKLSILGTGHTSPNPLVGAIVVNNDKIVGSGYHKEYGGPHAEVFALDEAGDKAKGATLYVTLEPCSHFGKTPPCAEKIIKMGIKRCVVAMSDPNPKVSGNGIKILRDAGISVEVGLLKNCAEEINRVFLKYITTKIPFLFLKCAITLDGKIATRDSDSKWITNEVSRKKVQYLRNKYMGLMVGINTIISDNPMLTARIENGINPYRIVIDPNLKIDLSSNFANFSDNKSIIITSENKKDHEKISLLENKNIKIIYLQGNNFKISDILSKIGKLGIDSILLEGGSNLISRAFRENFIDGGEIFIAPKILGDDKALPFIKGFDIKKISDGIELKNIKFNTYENNISVEFYK